MEFEVGKLYTLDSELLKCKRVIVKEGKIGPVVFKRVDENNNPIIVRDKKNRGAIIDDGVRIIFKRLSEVKEK